MGLGNLVIFLPIRLPKPPAIGSRPQQILLRACSNCEPPYSGGPRWRLCICKNPASRKASWPLQRRCSVAPGPERLESRLMQKPQAHHSKLHASEGLPSQFAFNDAKSREETDAGRLVDQEHGQTVVKSRHQQLQPDRSYLQACCNSNASVSPNHLSSL